MSKYARAERLVEFFECIGNNVRFEAMKEESLPTWHSFGGAIKTKLAKEFACRQLWRKVEIGSFLKPECKAREAYRRCFVIRYGMIALGDSKR